MPKYEATRTLLAPRSDVWAFLADPHRMADWWPGIDGVTPDRRGFQTGARWAIHGDNRPSLTRKAYHSGALHVLQVRPPESASWHLASERFDVQIALAEDGPERTVVTLTVNAPWHGGLRRGLPRQALGR